MAVHSDQCQDRSSARGGGNYYHEQLGALPALPRAGLEICPLLACGGHDAFDVRRLNSAALVCSLRIGIRIFVAEGQRYVVVALVLLRAGQ